MKKIFIDTNILIDLLADRKPYTKFAVDIFETVIQKKIRIYSSSHSIATTYYILKKYTGEKELRENIYQLLDYVNILPVDADVLKKALKSGHKDFEDAIQIVTAGTVEKMDAIVTRNTKDFKHSDIPVFAPDEIIGKI